MSDWNCTSPISIGQVQNVLLKQEKFSRERRNSIIDDEGGREGDPKEGHYIETVLTLHLSLCQNIHKIIDDKVSSSIIVLIFKEVGCDSSV